MRFRLDRVHVWSGEVEDKAGGVAAKLLPLAQAGANLGFVFTQRRLDRPGSGPVQGASRHLTRWRPDGGRRTHTRGFRR